MKKEILAAVIALIITVSSAAVITGCGCGNGKKDQQSTTAPSSTVESATETTTKYKSNKKATQPSTQKASGANSQSDLQTIALNSYGVSAADGYSAVQSGSTNVAEGTYNIFAVYDANGNLKTYVYIHTSGAPIFVGQDVFESNHGGNNDDNQGGGQDDGNSQDNGGGQDDGGNQSSDDNNQSSNQGGNQGGGQNYGGGNQGGDGHDYADKGY